MIQKRYPELFFLFGFAIILVFTHCHSSTAQNKPYFERIHNFQDIYSTNWDSLKQIFNHNNDTTYVINFWATWCKPCIEELPYFESVLDTFSNDPVRLYLISLDFPNQIEKRLFPFVKKHELRSTVIHLNDPDADKWINAIEPSWSGAIPATLVYNREHRSFHERAFENSDELKDIIRPFLQLKSK